MAENTTNIEETTTAQADEQEPDIAKTVETVEPVPTSEQRENQDTAEIPEKKEAEKKSLFHFRTKKEASFSRDEWILSNIRQEDIMDYLRLEHKKLEIMQQGKETRGKRIVKAFELTVSLAAVTAVTYFLKDNPIILITTLYTVGIIAVLWLWKHPNDIK